jgi:hypothetical protein
MDKVNHFPSVRLAAAGYASVVLLAWIGFVPGAFLPVDMRDAEIRILPAIVSACFSLFILVILCPVFWFGPARDRWLGSIAALLPGLVFVVTGLRLAGMVM